MEICSTKCVWIIFLILFAHLYLCLSGGRPPVGSFQMDFLDRHSACRSVPDLGFCKDYPWETSQAVIDEYTGLIDRREKAANMIEELLCAVRVS